MPWKILHISKGVKLARQVSIHTPGWRTPCERNVHAQEYLRDLPSQCSNLDQSNHVESDELRSPVALLFCCLSFKFLSKKYFSVLTTESYDSLYHRPSDVLPIVFAFHLELPLSLDNHDLHDFWLCSHALHSFSSVSCCHNNLISLSWTIASLVDSISLLMHFSHVKVGKT